MNTKAKTNIDKPKSNPMMVHTISVQFLSESECLCLDTFSGDVLNSLKGLAV